MHSYSPRSISYIMFTFDHCHLMTAYNMHGKTFKRQHSSAKAYEKEGKARKTV